MIVEPDIYPINKELLLITDPYIYEWRIHGERFRIVVPPYFMFNASCIPPVLTWCTGIRWQDHLGATILYSFLHAQKGEMYGAHQIFVDESRTWKSLYGRWYRTEANKLFCRMLREGKVPKKKRHLIYKGLHIFGGSKW